MTTTLNGEADMSERAPDSLVDFLALRLEGLSPELADKVRRLGDEQMRGLCEAVRMQQEEGEQVVVRRPAGRRVKVERA